jgi:hypothetical protein
MKAVMKPQERARIITILYNEVIRASQAVKETKNQPAEIHRRAQAALETAVQRYTDFSLDGHLPEDLALMVDSQQQA